MTRPPNPKGQGARAVTYKDQLENPKNARKFAPHQNQQEQPAQLASRKKDLLAHLEENIRGLGVTIETDEQTGTIGLKHTTSSEIAQELTSTRIAICFIRPGKEVGARMM